MRFDVLTLFPEMFDGYLRQSLLSLAIERGLVDVQTWNYRDWTTDKRKSVDDKPFGGGPGMLLMCGPVFDAVEAVQEEDDEPGTLVMMTPQGRPLDQALVEELATHKRLILLCGRYEGFDERIRTGLGAEQISIGDYVLSGGELAAMVLIDAVVRLLPGALGDDDSSADDSFSNDLLEYPQYTRPDVFRDMRVPDILLSGDHGKIAQWRNEQRIERTKKWRPDVYEKHINGNARNDEK